MPIIKATLEDIYLTKDGDGDALDEIKKKLGMGDEDFRVLTEVSRAAGGVRLSQTLLRYAVKDKFHTDVEAVYEEGAQRFERPRRLHEEGVQKARVTKRITHR